MHAQRLDGVSARSPTGGSLQAGLGDQPSVDRIRQREADIQQVIVQALGARRKRQIEDPNPQFRFFLRRLRASNRGDAWLGKAVADGDAQAALW